MCFLVVSKHPPPQTEYYNAPWWTWRAPDCCRTPAEAHLRLQAFAKEAVEAAACWRLVGMPWRESSWDFDVGNIESLYTNRVTSFIQFTFN